MAKKILILLGNTDPDSFSGRIANVYEEAASEAGHDVRRLNLGEMQFDPVLHKGYKEIQALELDLVAFQDCVGWADHIVIIYPNWWSAMPAKLKGLFDRAWLPGFAFNIDKETKRPVQHLKGKTTRVIITLGMQRPLGAWWKYGDYTNELQFGILEFAGIKARVSAFGPTERALEAQKSKWCERVKRFAVRAE
jgi:putative NADPH-quinone reductase